MDELNTSSTTPRLNKFRRRIITLGIVSFASYPLLVTVSWIIYLVTGKNTHSTTGFLINDSLAILAMYIFVFGLTLVVALSFVYSGILRWHFPATRSFPKLIKFTIFGVIVTMFSFAVLAILIVLVTECLHNRFSY